MEGFLRLNRESESGRDNQKWGSLTWLANKAIGNSENLTVGRVVIRAGESNPRHAHANCEEILVLLSGRLRHTIGDEEILMEPGDTLVVKPGVFHNGYSIGDGDADMMVIYNSAQRDFIKE